MTTVELEYFIRQSDLDGEVVSELEQALNQLCADQSEEPTSWHLEYDENIVALALQRSVQVESLAEYLHRADVLATAVLDRCSDELRDKVQASFAGIMPPDTTLYQE